MSAWRRRATGALPLTEHGGLEIVNGICLAAFRHALTPAALTDAPASFDEDWSEGRYVQADVLWRATLGARARSAVPTRRPSGAGLSMSSMSPRRCNWSFAPSSRLTLASDAWPGSQA